MYTLRCVAVSSKFSMGRKYVHTWAPLFFVEGVNNFFFMCTWVKNGR